MTNPEIGRTIGIGGIATNYHDLGTGAPVLFIHGSGPGVSAWANWRLNIPVLAERGLRCLAPDMLGFGYTGAPPDLKFSMQGWVEHLAGFTAAMGIERFSIVGNSFGGALALAYAIRFPAQVEKLVLMGSVGIDFPLTEGLDLAWGHVPTIANMRRLLDVFAFNEGLVSDDLAEMRHRAAMRPGVMEAFSAMFPAPRQDGIRALASPEEQIAGITAPALVIHGREDRVIPVTNAQRLFELLPKAELHLFRNCGHWTQIEKAGRFNALLADFLAG